MLEKLFKLLYPTVYINIVLKRSKTVVYIEVVSKEKVINSVEELFDTTSLNDKMMNFINLYTTQSPYSYVSFLDSSSLQGAIPTCSKNQLSYYADVSYSEYKCVQKQWTCYTSKDDLYESEKRYSELGVDFIFSPFILLSNFFKDKIDNPIALYILVEENYLSVAVFKHSELIYAEHLDLESSTDDEELLIADESEELNLEDEGIDLEDVDAIDDLDLFEDLGEIEDLDSLDDIDEFSETKDVEEEFHQELEEEQETKAQEGGFNEDYQRFTLIQTSVSHFYKDERFENEFVENVYIADGIGISSDLKRYLEEEMFLSVYIRHVELPALVCDIAKLELKSEV